MDIILCHTTADFDTLGAAVGCAQLQPGSRIVLTGGCHPAVRDFLALHRDEYPLIERRSVHPSAIRQLTIVDTQRRDRLGKAAEWLDLPQIKVQLYDHHLDIEADLGVAVEKQVESVGATTTLIVEQLQAQHRSLNPITATVMALGIHVDTGSLTFDQTTPRDALALAWLMQQGANISAIAQYVEPGLSPDLQVLLQDALTQIESVEIQGYQVARVYLNTQVFMPGLSGLTTRLMDLTESDAVLLAAQYCRGDRCSESEADNAMLSLIARTRIPETDWNQLFQPWGGGGHPRAATVTLRGAQKEATLEQIWQEFLAQIPHPPLASEIMSSPVRTIRPETTIAEAQRILLRYGHSGLSVVDSSDHLVGIISRRDLDIALHHGFSHAPVKGYMSNQLKTIQPNTPLPEIEAMMVSYDVGRLPVLDRGQLVGIVTRTDVLRQLHQSWQPSDPLSFPSGVNLPTPPKANQLRLDQLQAYLGDARWQLLRDIATAAAQQSWQLYLVGGAVRDLLIAAQAGFQPSQTFDDLDLVVDGCHPGAEQVTDLPPKHDPPHHTPQGVGAGVVLAKMVQQQYPEVRLQVHGRFQTAALLWHQDPRFDSLWVDIATSRTEFYPYPAANPEVEASSLQQDLYRRDFTINALAVKLTPPHVGQIIDFFGGRWDLQSRSIRVLHANSFIEDPTRIYRAVRFAVKLGFEIESQTEDYIRYAIASGVYDRAHLDRAKAPALQTRLKTELKYILQANYWQSALQRLNHLGALRCVHPQLTLTQPLWNQLRRLDRWLACIYRALPELAASLPAPWQLRLDILLASLPATLRHQVSEQLQLPYDCLQRLHHLDTDRERLLTELPHCDAPSQVFQTLSSLNVPELLLIAVQISSAPRRQIWQYVMQWTQVPPLLDGNDLCQLGYKPGPQFKPMLQALKFAQLDRQVITPDDARQFLSHHFPLPSHLLSSGEPV